jgi:acetyl-CoA synthetase
VIDKHKVNIFYTAPTAIRSLMAAGEDPVKITSRSSLRLLGSVGEPINPEAWEWYHRVSATSDVQSSIPGGRQKPAES